MVNYYNSIMVFGILAQQLEKAGKPITGVNLLEQRRASPNIRVGRRQDVVPAERHRCGAGSDPVKSTAPARASHQVATGRAAQPSDGVSPAFHERAAARRDLRADCGRFLADLRFDQDLPRRARLRLCDQRLHLLVARLEAGRAWPLATLAAVVAAAVFGLLMERFIYRPIQRHEARFSRCSSRRSACRSSSRT